MVLKRQPTADDVDPLAHIGRSTGHDVDKAYSFSRSTVKHDMPLQTQESDRNFTRTLSGDWGAESRHSHRTGGGDHQSG